MLGHLGDLVDEMASLDPRAQQPRAQSDRLVAAVDRVGEALTVRAAVASRAPSPLRTDARRPLGARPSAPTTEWKSFSRAPGRGLPARRRIPPRLGDRWPGRAREGIALPYWPAPYGTPAL